MMRVGVVGAGAVGAACVFALVMRGSAREIIIIDRTAARARAVALDMRYGAPLSPRTELRAGDYGDLAGAALVMITAGINEKAGGATDRGDPAGRLKLLDTNAGIYRDLVRRIVAAAPEAVILVVTDPPDPLADLARQVAGHDRVLSTGTYLDSLRFRTHLAERFGVDPISVEAQVLGEHGTSEVLIWSQARVGGVPVLPGLVPSGTTPEKFREDVEHDVRFANIAIIEGNQASQYGIGMICARIAEMVLRDEQAVIPIGSYSQEYGVTLSLPSVVGRGGVLRRIDPKLPADEAAGLRRSAQKLKEALSRIVG